MRHMFRCEMEIVIETETEREREEKEMMTSGFPTSLLLKL